MSSDNAKCPLGAISPPVRTPALFLFAMTFIFSERHPSNTPPTGSLSLTHAPISFSSRIMSNYKYSFITRSFSPNDTLPINSANGPAGSQEKQVSAQTTGEALLGAHHVVLDQQRAVGGGAVSSPSQPGTGAGTSDLGAVLGSDVRVLQSCLAPRARCCL